jgi:hypothetical protein
MQNNVSELLLGTAAASGPFSVGWDIPQCYEDSPSGMPIFPECLILVPIRTFIVIITRGAFALAGEQ